MEGLDSHYSNGKIQYKIFAAGINGATGLILPETPISGSNSTPPAFPLFSDDVIFLFSCQICTYNDLRFTSCALNGPPLSIQDQGQKIYYFSPREIFGETVVYPTCCWTAVCFEAHKRNWTPNPNSLKSSKTNTILQWNIGGPRKPRRKANTSETALKKYFVGKLLGSMRRKF